MFFNSFDFTLFLLVVFVLYWFVANKSLKFQNLLLLGSSYFFYAYWDYRFLFLLLFSTLLDYFTGVKMCQARDQRSRKIWLWLSVSINLGFLGFFKYYNFFVDSLADMISSFGLNPNPWTLKIILPVGISFYTFHGLSYVFDIYNNKIKAEKNFVDYAVFVSFFPLLVAGPIERATHLLPQIKKERVFGYAKAVDGLKQILWGLFKKVVIADQCAVYVNNIFENSSSYSGSTLAAGAILFAFQIYGDFSGYSDVAIGTAKLFGVDLLRNFAFPYFSRDIAEFWRRWHISLSSWFKDYLYIPLGGSRGETWKKVRNTFIIFLVSGLWHGANWTFVIWGALNAIYFLPLLLRNKNRKNLEIVARGKFFPTAREFAAMIVTFGLTVLAWVFFRSKDVGHAIGYLSGIFSASVFSKPELVTLTIFVLIAVFMLVEWIGREQQYAIATLGANWGRPLRWVFYYAIIIAVFWFGDKGQQFIYFQF